MRPPLKKRYNIGGECAMKQVYAFLEQIGKVPFAVLLIGTEVTAGLMLLCGLLPLSGQTELWFVAQRLGDCALRVLWASVVGAFACYVIGRKW